MPSNTKTRKGHSSKRGVKSPLRDVYADVTNRMLAQLEAGTVIWHQRWHSQAVGMPTNLDSGRVYRGLNVFILLFEAMIQGYPTNRWGSYKQITERGGQVRKGEHGTRVVWWSVWRKEIDEDGERKTKRIPLLREYTVFNEAQADWPAETDRRRKQPETETVAVDPIEAAEALIAEYLASGPTLRHGGDRACYMPGPDIIKMPAMADFEGAEHYYSTLYHEATHSTGHSKRLARQGIADGTFGAFGDKVYSEEELVAEMGAAMLTAIAGIEQASTFDDSANYIAHWMGALKADNKIVVRAAAAAQRAVDMVCGVTFDNDEEEGES